MCFVQTFPNFTNKSTKHNTNVNSRTSHALDHNTSVYWSIRRYSSYVFLLLKWYYILLNNKIIKKSRTLETLSFLPDVEISTNIKKYICFCFFFDIFVPDLVFVLLHQIQPETYFFFLFPFPIPNKQKLTNF